MKAKGVLDDVGRCLANKWNEEHLSGMSNADKALAAKNDNPWSLHRISEIKKELSPAIAYAESTGKNDADKKRLIMESD